MDRVVLTALLALLGVLAPAVDACNGYRLVVKKADTKCADGSTSVLSISNFGMSLTPDCKFVPRGCAKTSQKIESAEVTYSVKTAVGVPLVAGTVDGCDMMKQAAIHKEAAMMMSMFQLPMSCPVEPSERCADGKVIDISPFKDKLTPGSIKMEATVNHGNGKMSCLNFDGALKK